MHDEQKRIQIDFDSVDSIFQYINRILLCILLASVDHFSILSRSLLVSPIFFRFMALWYNNVHTWWHRSLMLFVYEISYYRRTLYHGESLFMYLVIYLFQLCVFFLDGACSVFFVCFTCVHAWIHLECVLQLNHIIFLCTFFVHLLCTMKFAYEKQ